MSSTRLTRLTAMPGGAAPGRAPIPFARPLLEELALLVDNSTQETPCNGGEPEGATPSPQGHYTGDALKNLDATKTSRAPDFEREPVGAEQFVDPGNETMSAPELLEQIDAAESSSDCEQRGV